MKKQLEFVKLLFSNFAEEMATHIKIREKDGR